MHVNGTNKVPFLFWPIKNVTINDSLLDLWLILLLSSKNSNKNWATTVSFNLTVKNAHVHAFTTVCSQLRLIQITLRSSKRESTSWRPFELWSASFEVATRREREEPSFTSTQSPGHTYTRAHTHGASRAKYRSYARLLVFLYICAPVAKLVKLWAYLCVPRSCHYLQHRSAAAAAVLK